MASEIRASLEELKSIAQELHNINKKTKELRLRKKELENKVLEYLDSNGKPGLKLDNIVFMTSEKRASAVESLIYINNICIINFIFI